MSSIECATLKDAAPELILGVLPGDERAAAVAHLDGCVPCQQHVASLAGVTDQLLLLSPVAQPSAGFEQRVLTALVDDQRPPSPRSHLGAWRRSAAVLVLAACLALAAVLLLGGGPTAPAFASGEMRTPSGAVVGEVWVHRLPPAVVFMSLPGWAEQVGAYAHAGDTFSVRIERSDGSAVQIPVELHDTSWVSKLDLDPAAVASVAIVDAHGRVWCEAHLAMGHS